MCYKSPDMTAEQDVEVTNEPTDIETFVKELEEELNLDSKDYPTILQKI